ncbi:hypothetical protein L596_010373 [Steinernema carpocapsae]|uniref:Uncharacterized protein n=1 Tax=Steinernema carpocapsae TaxID=34508 RepID=A0A4U5PI77_STECR|nr:hypothetical protein L596_010373 [Steinernema carpocapsae]
MGDLNKYVNHVLRKSGGLYLISHKALYLYLARDMKQVFFPKLPGAEGLTPDHDDFLSAHVARFWPDKDAILARKTPKNNQQQVKAGGPKNGKEEERMTLRPEADFIVGNDLKNLKFKKRVHKSDDL